MPKNGAIRMLLLAIIVPSVYYFVYWVPFSPASLHEHYWLTRIVSLFLAILAGWFVWSGTRGVETAHGFGKMVVLGAIIAGGIGFSAGFFGPLIFMHSANQGPLIGIFITGPLGFLLGGFGGFIYWLVQNKRKR